MLGEKPATLTEAANDIKPAAFLQPWSPQNADGLTSFICTAAKDEDVKVTT